MTTAISERCKHQNLIGNIQVARLTEVDDGPVTGYDVSAKVECSDCGMPFQWIGLERGSSFAKPMTSVDGLELRAPITPLEEL